MMPHTEQMRDSGATSPPLLLPAPAPLPAALLPAAQSRLEWRECRPRAVERVAGLAERLPGARGELQETGVPGWEAEPGSNPWARSKRRVCFTPWGVSGRGQQVVSCQSKKGKSPEMSWALVNLQRSHTQPGCGGNAASQQLPEPQSTNVHTQYQKRLTCRW